MKLFPNAKLTHVCSTRSNHLPLLLDLEEKQPASTADELPKYEYMWERDPNLLAVIEEAWASRPTSQSLSDLHDKLNATRKHLKTWSKENFGSVTIKIRRKRNRINTLWNKPMSPGRDEEVNKISLELDELLHREEMMWRQRSRVTWLQEGDRKHQIFPQESHLEAN